MTHNSRTAAVESLLAEFPEDPSFLADNGRSVISFPGGQKFYIDDPSVKDWLLNSYLCHNGVVASNAALSAALQLLRLRARTYGACTPVALRLAADNAGSIFLDLANARNEVARITPAGWSVTNFTPDRAFVSVRGLLSIPTPQPPENPQATLDPLRPLLNCASDESWNGITDWLSAAFHPDEPCPILILHGPPGSGKTTAARLLRTLIDPNYNPLAALPSRGSAVEHQGESHHVLAFDHITRMSGSATDALCRLSSGALGPSHPIILTVPRMDATDWQPRADLAARAITVRLPAIDHPRPQMELQAEFENLRPTLLSALLTKVSIEPRGVHAPANVRDLLFKASAEQDPLYKSLANFMQTRDQWTGTATDLLNEICVTLTPRALSQRLRVLAPTLPITVEFHRIHNGHRQITMTKVGQDCTLQPISNRPSAQTDSPPSKQAPVGRPAALSNNHQPVVVQPH